MAQDRLQQLIADLTAAVQNFHQRFGLVGPSTTEELLSRIPIQREELLELHQAILRETPERVASEAVDVLYVAIGTLLRIDQDLVEAALAEVIEKNDAKTTQSHQINSAGKVVRRAKTLSS